MKRGLVFLRKQWFLCLLFAAVAVGLVAPRPGVWLANEVGAKPFIIVLLFLTSLTFNTRELIRGFRSPKPILLSLLGTYCFLPLFFYLGDLALGSKTPLGFGLIVLGVAPTSLASAAIYTRLAGGNAALSVAMTVINHSLNVLMAPCLLWLLMGQSLTLSPLSIARELACFVLAPILLGQVLGRMVDERRSTWIRIIGVLSRLLLLLVIVQAASTAVWDAEEGLAQEAAGKAADHLSLERISLLLACCVGAHLLAVGCMELGGKFLRLPPAERLACLFVGSQKTLPASILILKLFPAMQLGIVSLVIYHASQLVLGTFFLEYARRKPGQESSAGGNAQGVAESG